MSFQLKTEISEKKFTNGSTVPEKNSKTDEPNAAERLGKELINK